MKNDMKTTDYYQSGKHAEHLANARIKSNQACKDAANFRKQQYLLSPTTCTNCNGILEYPKRHNKFCSNSCSATYSNTGRKHTEATRKRLSDAAKETPKGFAKTLIGGANRKGERRAPRITIICATCNKNFEKLLSDPRKTCSKECVKLGGMREGSGRAKTGFYKGIYCGSTYELAFLVYNVDNGSPIQRCRKSFLYKWNDNTYRYYPDFEINGTIYEIKGRMQPVDLVKISSCNATLISKDDIKPYIEYVSKTYGVPKDKLWLLYDCKEYKLCNQCGIQFIPKSKKGIYCSQSCSLKANRLLSPRFACK